MICETIFSRASLLIELNYVSCPDLKNRLPNCESSLRMEIFLEMEGAGISVANEGEFSDGLSLVVCLQKGLKTSILY